MALCNETDNFINKAISKRIASVSDDVISLFSKKMSKDKMKVKLLELLEGSAAAKLPKQATEKSDKPVSYKRQYTILLKYRNKDISKEEREESWKKEGSSMSLDDITNELEVFRANKKIAAAEARKVKAEENKLKRAEVSLAKMQKKIEELKTPPSEAENSDVSEIENSDEDDDNEEDEE